jgi:hypothetical protein
MAFRLRSQGAPFKQIGSSPALKYVSPVKQVEGEPVLKQELPEVRIEGNKPGKYTAENLDFALGTAGMIPALGVVPDLLNVISNGAQTLYHGVTGKWGSQKTVEAWQRTQLAGLSAIPLIGIGVGGSKITLKGKDVITAKMLKVQKLKLDKQIAKALKKGNAKKLEKFDLEMKAWQTKYDDFVLKVDPKNVTKVGKVGDEVVKPKVVETATKVGDEVAEATTKGKGIDDTPSVTYDLDPSNTSHLGGEVTSATARGVNPGQVKPVVEVAEVTPEVVKNFKGALIPKKGNWFTRRNLTQVFDAEGNVIKESLNYSNIQKILVALGISAGVKGTGKLIDSLGKPTDVSEGEVTEKDQLTEDQHKHKQDSLMNVYDGLNKYNPNAESGDDVYF